MSVGETVLLLLKTALTKESARNYNKWQDPTRHDKKWEEPGSAQLESWTFSNLAVTCGDIAEICWNRVAKWPKCCKEVRSGCRCQCFISKLLVHVVIVPFRTGSDVVITTVAPRCQDCVVRLSHCCRYIEDLWFKFCHCLRAKLDVENQRCSRWNGACRTSDSNAGRTMSNAMWWRKKHLNNYPVVYLPKAQSCPPVYSMRTTETANREDIMTTSCCDHIVMSWRCRDDVTTSGHLGAFPLRVCTSRSSVVPVAKVGWHVHLPGVSFFHQLECLAGHSI